MSQPESAIGPFSYSPASSADPAMENAQKQRRPDPPAGASADPIEDAEF
jgi:hypothetical protein